MGERLAQAGLATEIVVIETKGDKILDQALSKIGSKGLFTEELEEALRLGEIDLAVHSAKDMPAALPQDLPLLAFTEREAVHDVAVSYDSSRQLTPEASWLIGTSSVRRAALLQRFYPHCRVVNVRGNLQTRMKRLEEGVCDLLLLAYAGVHRMGYEAHITTHLPPETFTPPVGQGSVAIQISEAHLAPALRAQCQQALNHPPTALALRVERAFLATLQGGCSIPAFGWAKVEAGTLLFRAGVVSLSGERMVRYENHDTPENAAQLGQRAAEYVLTNGGREILNEIRS